MITVTFQLALLLTLSATNVAAMNAPTFGEPDSARVAVFTHSGTMSVGCMRSTSGVCYVLINSKKGVKRLDVKSGTVGGAGYVLAPISVAVSSQPLNPNHCAFHKIVQDDQMISGPNN